MAEVSFAGLRRKRAMRLSKFVAIVQSLVILLLLVVMSEEYDHNEFFQAWAGAHFGGFAFFLNGTLTAFYAGLVIAYYLRSSDKEGNAVLIRKKKEIPLEAETFSS